MSRLHPVPPPPREAFRRALRGALPHLGRPLRPLLEDVLGLDGRIDVVAADASGRVVLVLLAETGGDLELVGHALAQRAWLEPRLADWLKLAPELDLRPGLGAELLLVAPGFEPRARAAARAADPSGIALVEARFVSDEAGGPPRLLLETLHAAEESSPATRASTSATPPRQPRSSFRTGLSDGDLGLARPERASE